MSAPASTGQDSGLCEVCQRPATVSVCDYEESADTGYMVRKPAGDVHHFCDDHQRAARVLKSVNEHAERGDERQA